MTQCGECPHAPTSHGEYGDGCEECSCLLSTREATEGRDEEMDESIRQALHEDALIEGYDPEPGGVS